MKGLSHELFSKYKYWYVDYSYPESDLYAGCLGKTGRFFLEVRSCFPDFRAASIEENVISDIGQPVLTADIVGSLSEADLVFQKSYKAETGHSHAILFRAMIDFELGLISGEWHSLDNTIANPPLGSFSMHLDEGEFALSNIGRP